jgi:hypothetical protein
MRRVLRYDDSSTSQAVACDPSNQGQEFDSYKDGCKPWYTYNDYSGPPWWLPPAPGACPDKNGIEAEPQPWQCVLNAPGTQPNIIGDGIATAIGNCMPGHIQNNGCNRFSCINKNYYDPSKPNQWALGTGTPSPRVVLLFIVPYGSYKGVGSQDGLPIENFAAFYVTGWRGNGGSGQNPCEGVDPDGAAGPIQPDEVAPQKGSIVGYFVGYTLPNAPGDPHSICVLGQLRPCVPVLVR